jgi:hypothetical protein
MLLWLVGLVAALVVIALAALVFGLWALIRLLS